MPDRGNLPGQALLRRADDLNLLLLNLEGDREPVRLSDLGLSAFVPKDSVFGNGERLTGVGADQQQLFLHAEKTYVVFWASTAVLVQSLCGFHVSAVDNFRVVAGVKAGSAGQDLSVEGPRLPAHRDRVRVGHKHQWLSYCRGAGADLVWSRR